MPRTPIDYSKTLIYKLVKNDDYDNANVYVGSTTDFTRRKTNIKQVVIMKNIKSIMTRSTSIFVRMADGTNG